MKLQKYSEVFMTETQNGFREEQSCTDPAFCLKLHWTTNFKKIFVSVINTLLIYSFASMKLEMGH